MIPYIFLLLGIGVLVPWNVFISLKSYYEARFCSTANLTETNGTNIESRFATAYNLSSIITMILLIAVRLFRDHKRGVHPYRTNGYDSIVTADDITTTSCMAHHSPYDIPALATKEETSLRVLDPVEISSEYDTDDNPHLDDHHSHRSDRPVSSVDVATQQLRVTNHDYVGIERQQQQQQQQPCSLNHVISNTPLYSYSWWFVILPFSITILVLFWQLVLVWYVQSKPFGYDMYTITIFCIAICGITSALLGTGIITVISSLPSIVPIQQMMNPYQYVRCLFFSK